ncbi:putative hemolysin [Yersinia enterocolitica]|nr:putative hemolysin [Yersinia enterocolitica]
MDTRKAPPDGTITVRDTDKQQQNVDDLSRDVEHANNALTPIFDKEKKQNRLREAQLIGEIGSQVSDVIRTQGDINGLKAAKEKLGPLKENATEKDRAEYMEKLRNSDVYKDEMKKNGTGSALQQGVQAATAAIQGLAGASAPYLAEVIHNMTTDANGKVNVEANLMAHAVLGAVMAQVNGNSALAGASGAVMGEYIAQQMYPGRLREAQLIGEIGSQVSDVIRTQGDINGLKAAKEKLGPLKENATEKDRAEYMEKLRNSDVYKDEMKKNGTGSVLQQSVQAATAAIQGLAGGVSAGISDCSSSRLI